MILEETDKTHRKHTKLTRPQLGTFGRNEIAIVGTSCANIKAIANSIIEGSSKAKVAYVDADHAPEKGGGDDAGFTKNNDLLLYTDKISFQRIDFNNQPTPYQRRCLFNDRDLIIVNGNHFTATSQIVVIDPIKNLEKKRDELTDVKLILLKDEKSTIPSFITEISGFKNIPVFLFDEHERIVEFVNALLAEKTPPLCGLVLSGGMSRRMKQDKGNLDYHGKTQREHLYRLLSRYCRETFVSCNAAQAAELAGNFPVIEDTFLGLGPLGGILSAFQTNPNAAWLVVACDLPYLSEKTIEYLIENRNSSKTAATFLDPEGKFPEPLVTIWEPKSYLTLLQFLAQGYSCPRKALINSSIQLLNAPDRKDLLNVNFPEEYEKASQDLKQKNSR